MTPDQRRIAIRVAFFWAAFWAVLFAFRTAPIPAIGESVSLLVGTLVGSGALVLVVLFVRREQASLADVGMAWRAGSLRRFLLGAVLGAMILGAMLLALTLATSLTIERVPTPNLPNALGYSLHVLLVLAAMEEIAFRSYPLVRLREAFGVRTAIYVTSFFFAAYHGLDPMNLLGPGVWGLLYGLAALESGGLALPLGMHFGLNWMQSLFGMKTQFASSIWTVSTGADDGLVTVAQAGVILQLIVLVVGVVLIERHVRRGSEPKALT